MKKNILNFLKQNNYLITIGKFIIGILMFIIIDIFYLKSVSKYFTNMTKNIRLRRDYLIIPIFFIYLTLFSTLHHFVLKNINFDFDKITNYAYILPQLLNSFFFRIFYLFYIRINKLCII